MKMHVCRGRSRKAEPWGESYGRKKIIFQRFGEHSVTFAPATIEVPRCVFSTFPLHDRFFFVLKGNIGLNVDGSEIDLADACAPLTKFSAEARTECYCRTPNASAFNVIHSRNASVQRFAHGSLRQLEWSGVPVRTLDSIYVYSGSCNFLSSRFPAQYLAEGDAVVIERQGLPIEAKFRGNAKIVAVSVHLN